MVKKLEHFQELINADSIEIPVGDFLGMHLIEVGEGFATVESYSQSSLLNSIGYVQGGVLASIADETMAIAFGTEMEEDEHFTSLEFKINFIRPVIEGRILAKAKVVHRGNRTGVCECEIFNDSDKLATKVIGTFMYL